MRCTCRKRASSLSPASISRTGVVEASESEGIRILAAAAGVVTGGDGVGKGIVAANAGSIGRGVGRRLSVGGVVGREIVGRRLLVDGMVRGGGVGR